MTADDLRSAFGNPNVKGFFEVVREGETNHFDSAYRLINGGTFFTDMSHHPFEGMSTFHGGKAAGVVQYLPSTWDELARKYDLPDFSVDSQNLGFVGCLVKRKALSDVLEGRFDDAVAKCRLEWTSLPGASESHRAWTLDKARAMYLQYGGTLASAAPVSETQDPPAPIEDRSEPYIGSGSVGGADNSNTPMFAQKSAAAQPDTGAPMPALALLSLFAPVLQSLIPQISNLFKPKGEVAQRNTELAETVLNTILSASGQPNLQAALEAMQANKDVKQTVQQAVVSHPDIMPFIEIGGGPAAARENDLKVMATEKPFWKTSAVFWVSMVLLPLVYWLVGSTIVGGVAIPQDWPWWVQLPLKLFGVEWTGEARSSTSSLVIGLVLGGMCGVYYGVSVTQQKQASASGTTSG